MAALEFPAMRLSATAHGRLEEGRTSPRRPDSSRPTWIPSWPGWRPRRAGECSGASRPARRPRFPWRPGELRITASILPRSRRRGRTLDDPLAGTHSVGPRAAHGGQEPGRGHAGGDHGIRRHGRRRERRRHRARAGTGEAAAAAGPGHPGRSAGGARLTGTALEAVSIRGRWPVGTLFLLWPRAVRGGRSRSAAGSWPTGAELARSSGPGSRCRPGDRLRRRERVVAGAYRQRAARGGRPSRARRSPSPG